MAGGLGYSWDGGKRVISEARGVVATVSGVGYSGTNYTTFTVATARTAHVATNDCYDLQLVYTSILGSAGAAETGFSNDFEIKCSIECSNGTIVPCFFEGGKRVALVKPKAVLKTLPVGVTISRGTTFYVRTWCNRLASDAYVAANGEPGNLAADVTNFPNYHAVRGASMGYTTRGEGVTWSGSTGIDPFTYDATDSGTISASNNVVYAPVAIIGKISDGFSRSCLIVGDSIAAGAGDTWMSPTSGRGFLQRACEDRGVAPVIAALGGDRASYWVDPGIATRSHLATYCTSAIVAMGSNDIVNGVSVAATKTALQNLISLLEKRVQKVAVCTVIPRTTSTDGWMTSANQIPSTSNSFNDRRRELNYWIRKELGYPVFDTARAIEHGNESGVFLSPESAALSSTSTSGTSTTLTDTTQTWSTNQWAGYNVVFGSQVKFIVSNTATAITITGSFSPAPSTDPYSIVAATTSDGVHPSGIGHRAMADAVNVSILFT